MKNLLLLLSAVLLSVSTFAQEYKAMMDDMSVNFYDVCEEADKYFDALGKKGKGSGYKGYQRWKHANEYKYYPSGRRDNVDPYFASNAYTNYLKNNPSQKNIKSLFPNGWQELGPATVDYITGHYSAGLGRVEEIYVDPNDANRIYIGSRSGGFWKTQDGGSTWTGGSTDFLPASGVNAIAVVPGSPNDILINVRNAKNGYSHGIYRSTDGGNSWMLSNFSPANVGFGGLGSSFKINKIAYHPTIPNLVFVATNRGFYRSTDNLATWTHSATVISGDSYYANVSDIDFHPTNPNIVYILDITSGNSHRDNVLISSDVGVSFSTSGTVTGNAGTTGYVAVTPDCPSCVFFASSQGVWKSVNEGVSFSFLINPDEDCHAGFAVNDQDADNILYGYVDTEISTDGGMTFNQVTWWSLGNSNHGSGTLQQNFENSNVYVHADLRDAECVNGVFYTATDGYLCKSTDNGQTWEYLSEGTAIRENYKLGVSQSNHYRTICGSQDNGTSIKRQNGWLEFYGADGMEAFIHPLNDDWMVGSVQYGSRRRTKDGGESQDGISPSGQSGSGNGYWEAPILFDPNDQMRIYNFSKSVYVSDDFGSSWSALGAPVTFSDPIQHAAIAENNSSIIIISKGEKIEKSTDGGATFVDIKNNLPGDAIRDITFDPKNDNTIFVVYATYQNNGNKVYMSTDGGSNWTNITYNLGNMPVHTLVVDHSADANLYIGTEVGVFTKTMAATTWTLYNPDLPTTTTEELEIVYGSNTLRAATWGRGLWEYTLIGRADYPAILKTDISDPPSEDKPKATVPQYVTSEIHYDNALTSVYVEWSANAPTFGNVISMSNSGGETWVSDQPIPDYPAGTKMYFKVFAVGSSGDVSETYKFMYEVKPFEYCNAIGNNNGGNNELHITNVTIANVNNSTSDNAYYNLFNDVVNLQLGQTYAVSVTGAPGWPDNDYAAWIDYNGDANFDQNESLGLVEQNNSTATAMFTVPASAVTTKQLRLRVRLSYWGNDPSPCGNTFGEVEDYHVQVADPCSVNIGIDDVTMNEGTGGATTSFTFTVSLDDDCANPVTVNYNTTNGTTSNDDLVSLPSGTLTFNDAETSHTLTVQVNEDCLVEGDETFMVNLTGASSGTITDNQGLGTITNDDTAPAIACPNSLMPAVISLGANCTGTVPDYTSQVTATFDPACASVVQSPAIGTAVNTPGPLTITFTIDDGVNPAVSCNATVTVADTEAPQISCPSLPDVDGCLAVVPDLTGTILANSSTGFSGTQGLNGWSYGMNFANDPGTGFTNLPNWTGFVWNNPGTILDFPQLDANGGHPQLENLRWAVRRWTSNYSGEINISGSFYDRDLNCGDGAHVRIFKNGVQIWEYLNIPGNSTNYSTNVDVSNGDFIDFAIDPIFDGGCDDTHFTAEIKSAYEAVATDNCGVVNITQNTAAGTVLAPGMHNIQVTAFDAAGLSTSCTATLSVQDGQAPVANCHANVTAQILGGTAQVNTTLINDGSTDNCGIVNMTLSGQTTYGCNDVGQTFTVTLTVYDAAGSISSCNSNVSVVDPNMYCNQPPVAVCKNVTVNTDANCQGIAVAADFDNGSNDPDGDMLSFSVNPQGPYSVGVTNVTLTVSTPNGGSDDCTATITVTDNTPPVANCQNVTAQLDANGVATITASEINNGSTDACGIQSLDIDQSSFDCNDIADFVLTGWINEFHYDNSSTDVGEFIEVVGTGDISTWAIALYNQTGLNYHNEALSNGTVATEGDFHIYTLLIPGIQNGSNDGFALIDDQGSVVQFLSYEGITTAVEGPAVGMTSTDVGVSEPSNTPIGKSLQLQGSGNEYSDFVWAGPIDQTVGASNTGQSLISVFPQVTLTVTDNNGNTASCTASITVEDNVAPDITCPNTITVDATSPSGAVVNYNTPVGTDNCTPTTVQTTGLASGATFPIGTTTNTFDVTDQEGTTFNCAFNVTVTGVAPSIVCPANISVNTDPGQCGATVTFTATDNTGIPSSVITYSQDPGTSFPVGTTTVTATATNTIGTDQCSFTITVTDNTPPEAVCEDIMVTLDANGSVTITPGQVDNGSNDACGIQSLSLSQSTFSCSDVDGGYAANPAIIPGTPTELTVTDANGNTATCTAMVIVVDNTSPAITCPDNMQVSAASTSGATVAYTPPVGTDNCTPTTTQTAGLPSGSTFPIGTTTNTFTVEDPSGATASCSFDVTVTAVSPDIVCPDNITVGTDDGQCSAVVTFAATDNTVVPASMISYSHASGSAFPVGTTTVTATAASIFGRDNCTFDITVNDNEIPSITCPGNITMTATGPSGAVVTYTPPVGTDNCTPTTFQTAGFASGATFPVGTTTNTFLVSDQAGSVSICSFTVTVSGVAPDIVCPADITVDADPGQCNAQVNFAATETTGIPASTISYSHASGSTFPVSTTIVTATATNAVGTDQCTFTITVEDNEDPAIPTLANVTGECEATATAPTTTDNCAGTITGTTFDPLSYNTQGTHVITWSFDDGNGNIVTATQNVIVNDVTNPVITCAAPVSVSNDAGDCAAVVSVPAPTVSDNCLNSYPSGSMNDPFTTIAQANTVVIPGIYHFNISGNQFSTYVEEGWVLLASSPATATTDLTITSAVTLQSNTILPPAVYADPSIDHLRINATGGPDLPLDVTTNNANVLNNLANNIILSKGLQGGVNEWTGTGASSRMTFGCEGSQTYNFPLHRGIFQACGNGNGLHWAPSVIESNGRRYRNVRYFSGAGVGNDLNLWASATLNAPQLVAINDYNNTADATDTYPVGTTTVTWTVMDAVGNTSTCTQDVTVTDNEAPAISCPGNISLVATSPSGAVATFTPPVGTDNCLPTTTQTAGLASGSTFPVGMTTNTFTVTDPSGGSVSCSFTVTVTGVAPDIVCPMDIIVDTDPGLCSAVVDFQATENTGIPPSVIDYSHAPGSTFNVGMTIVTASASNVVGTDECSFTITVEDNTDPVISCPDDIIMSTGTGLCGANVEFDVMASDNCSETTVVCTIGEQEQESDCATNNVDLSITFDNYPGETSWMLMTIQDQVVESGGPYYGQPGGSTLDLSFNLPDGQYIFVIKDALGDGICCAYGQGSYTLSSEGNVIVSGGMFEYSEKTTFCVETPSSGSESQEVQSGDFFPVGTTTVTCTVTDGSGNIDVCTFDITVNDTEAPILDIPCPENITLCGAQNVDWTPPTATDNCGVAFSTNNYNPGDFFEVGMHTVTYTFYDKAGLSVSCSFTITINPSPDVVITQEDVPLWCQGIRLLTAKVLNPEELNYPLTFDWSNGLPGNPSVIVPANGTYFVTVTDALGCETEVSTVVNEDISSLFSAYTIISGEEFEMYASDVIGGGVGIEDADEAEIGLNSNIFTFLRADANNVAVDGTSFINEFIDDDLEVVLPPFQNNPNNVVTSLNVPAGTTMTLSNSIYGYVNVGTGATLIIDNGTMYMQNLKTAKGATIIFTQPTDLMIRRRMSIGETNTINPDGHTCVIYVGDEASINQGSVVTLNIYSPEGLEVNDSGATLTTYMTGIFICNDQVISDYNVVWNWNLNCSYLPSGGNGDLPIAQPADNSESIAEETGSKHLSGLNVYPNPTSGVINVDVEFFLGQQVEYIVYDSFGKEIMRKVIDQLELPVITIDMSPAQFANGLYQMSLKCEDEMRAVRFVLSK